MPISVRDLRDPVALGRHLRTLREEANLSQEALSAHLHRAQSFASRVERGATNLTLDQVIAWIERCGKEPHLGWAEEAVATPDPREAEAASLARLPAEDLAVLRQAGDLLDRAPTARERLAFEVRMWAREAGATEARAALSAIVRQLGDAVDQGDAEAMRLLRERWDGAAAGSTTETPSRAQKK